MRTCARTGAAAVALAVSAHALAVTPGSVIDQQKISSFAGGFTGDLDPGDRFGWRAAGLGDLDGDGRPDVAVTARNDDDGGADNLTNLGAVWILFLDADGSVSSHQKISATAGGFAGGIDDDDNFGASIANIGDVDGDGVVDLAVGATGDDDGGLSQFDNRGAVWILFLNADGTVKDHQKISDTAGGFTGVLDAFDNFGSAVTALGDLDDDGVTELAVGVDRDDDGGRDRGAVWILYLNRDGTVKSHAKISATSGGFTGTLDLGDRFGISVNAFGDLDGDGIRELAVGASLDDDGGANSGAVWLLYLDAAGAVREHRKINATSLDGGLDADDNFGWSLGAPGDLDGNGERDLAVGARWDDDGDSNQGAVWLVGLGADGAVTGHVKISETAGGFTGDLDNGDDFGNAIAVLAEPAGAEGAILVVGAINDDDGGQNNGAAYVLFLAGRCPGDTDGNAVVDVDDLNHVILDWGSDGSAHGGDLTGQAPGSDPDGVVDVNDLNAVFVNWGGC